MYVIIQRTAFSGHKSPLLYGPYGTKADAKAALKERFSRKYYRITKVIGMPGSHNEPFTESERIAALLAVAL